MITSNGKNFGEWLRNGFLAIVVLLFIPIYTSLAEIKGSRFTSADGLLVWQEIASIREKIAQLPTVSPPAWFSQRVDKMEDRQLEILTRLGRIEAGLGKAP